MSKMGEMSETIKELRDAAAAIEAAANWLTEMFSSDPETEGQIELELNPAPKLEEVRAILADKSRAGYTAQIRDLLQKYGADKLSAVDPAHYRSLIAEVEVLGNAT